MLLNLRLVFFLLLFERALHLSTVYFLPSIMQSLRKLQMPINQIVWSFAPTQFHTTKITKQTIWILNGCLIRIICAISSTYSLGHEAAASPVRTRCWWLATSNLSPRFRSLSWGQDNGKKRTLRWRFSGFFRTSFIVASGGRARERSIPRKSAIEYPSAKGFFGPW